MDSNQTRFHALLSREDWQDGPDRGLAWDPAAGALSLRPRLFLAPERPVPGPARRRGAACDRFGNGYWITEDGREIHRQRAGATAAQRLWPDPEAAPPPPTAAGPFRPVPEALVPAELQGLAVTEHHYLVAGTVSPPGLLVFDLYLGGPSARVLWRRPFAPVDLAAVPGGGLWVLDRGEGLRFWSLDRSFRPAGGGGPAPGAFRPLGRPRHRQPAAPRAGAAVALSEPNPIALTALPDGSLLVLNAAEAGGSATLSRYVQGHAAGSARLELPTDALEPAPGRVPAAPVRPLAASDLAFLPDSPDAAVPLTGTLYVLTAADSQCFAFALSAGPDSLALEPLILYLPMPHAGRRGLIAAPDGVYYDCAGQWLRLAPQTRPRHEPVGVFTSRVLDGHEQNCLWHRLFLDAVIPAGAAVVVETRVSNDLIVHDNGRSHLPETIPWVPEPVPYRRRPGSELPYHRPFPDAAPDDPTAGTWETLLQRARGRYLQFRLTLQGNGRTTPLIRAARIYYPRFSYLTQYLPDIYQDNEASAAFLDSFLANPEGLFTALADQMAQARILSDPRATPPEYLDWLAGWFGLMLDTGWGEARRRLFLTHAFDFYRFRGTLTSLVRAIRLATDAAADESIFTADIRPWVGLPTAVAMHGSSFRIVEGYVSRTEVEAARPLLEGERPPGDDAYAQRQFQEFMRRRYLRIERYNERSGTAHASFRELRWSEEPPASEALRRDWEDFRAEALPRIRQAHRFTVLLPVTADGGERRPDLKALQRVIELEKPAHTHYEVRPYWAMFRVGYARLGLDSILGRGSRAAALVLGQGELGGSFLGYAYPWHLTDRLVVGRDRLPAEQA